MTTSVVMLHGGGTSARQWDLVLERMTAPALALDVPGRGDRPADVERLTLPQALDSLASDVGAADAGTAGPVSLVAHSSGGLLVPGLDRQDLIAESRAMAREIAIKSPDAPGVTSRDR